MYTMNYMNSMNSMYTMYTMYTIYSMCGADYTRLDSGELNSDAMLNCTVVCCTVLYSALLI